MNFDKDELIAGERLLRIRGILSYFERWSGGFDTDDLARRLECDCERSRSLLNALVQRGFITQSDEPSLYKVTDLGRRLIAWRAVPRITRAKANKLISGLLERVEEINARDELAYRVTYIGVFGSYAAGRDDLGDIDIAFDLEWRDPSRKRGQYDKQRFKAAGRYGGNLLDQLFYGRYEVLRLLKARSPYLSLHDRSELDEIGVTAKQLFPAPEHDA